MLLVKGCSDGFPPNAFNAPVLLGHQGSVPCKNIPYISQINAHRRIHGMCAMTDWERACPA